MRRLAALCLFIFVSYPACASRAQKITDTAAKLDRLTVNQTAAGYFESNPRAKELWQALLRFYFGYPDLKFRLYTKDKALLLEVTLPGKKPAAFVFEDGRSKSFAELLNEPDLADTFVWPYPAGNSYTLTKDTDPGRVRYLPFFTYVYGDGKDAVKQNIVNLKWPPTLQPVHKRARAAFEQAFKESGTGFVSFPKGPATFNWRFIAGTKRLSNHSFAISIDMDPKLSAYWRWDGDKWLSKVNTKLPGPPAAVIKAFESAGFVWGGKWYHYDTMHFEYRPEFFVDPKLLKRYSID